MKARICPNCSFRNFTPNPRCSQCGELLLEASQPESKPATKSTRPMAPKVNTPYPLTTVESAPLAPPPIPEEETTTLTPASSSPLTSSTSAPITPLPRQLTFLGTPTVEGEVVDVGMIQNEDKSLKAGDVLHYGISAALLVTKPLYGLMSIASGARKPKEFRSIATFRIRTARGQLVEVRIEKDVVGATINIGDYVSAWGQVSGGVVILRNAYNHTIRGEVRLR